MKKFFTFAAAAIMALAANAETTTVWEGTLDAPEWGPLSGVANDAVKGLVADGTIKVGTVMTVYGTRTADDYCSIALVNEWWTSVIDGSTEDDRTVLTFNGTEPTSASFTVCEETITQINNAGFFINGHGYTLTKIEVTNKEAEPQPTGSVLYENADGFTLDWNVLDAADQTMKDAIKDGSIVAGTVLKIEVEEAATDYHKIALIDETWASLLNGGHDDEREDIDGIDCSQPVAVTITQAFIDRVLAEGTGRFWLSGHGVKVTKIYYESNATGITSARKTNTGDAIGYNLAGVRANKGLIIVNGKKIIKL